MKLKPHLQKTLIDIHNFHNRNNRMPTVRELFRSSRGNPKSISSLQHRIDGLVEAGYLVRGEFDTARTIRFGKQIDIVDGKIPVLGTCN